MPVSQIKVGEEVLTKKELCRRVLAVYPNATLGQVVKHVLDQYGVKVNSGTACSVRTALFGKKPVLVSAEKKTAPPKPKPKQEAPKPQVSPFIEGLKHIKEAMKLLGDKSVVIDLVEIL